MRVLELSELEEVSGGWGWSRRRCGSKSWGKGSGKNSGKSSNKSSGKGSGKSSGKGSGKGCVPVPVCPPVVVVTPPVGSVP